MNGINKKFTWVKNFKIVSNNWKPINKDKLYLIKNILRLKEGYFHKNIKKDYRKVSTFDMIYY